jgi:hypothetical protein
LTVSESRFSRSRGEKAGIDVFDVLRLDVFQYVYGDEVAEKLREKGVIAKDRLEQIVVYFMRHGRSITANSRLMPAHKPGYLGDTNIKSATDQINLLLSINRKLQEPLTGAPPQQLTLA